MYWNKPDTSKYYDHVMMDAHCANPKCDRHEVEVQIKIDIRDQHILQLPPTFICLDCGSSLRWGELHWVEASGLPADDGTRRI